MQNIVEKLGYNNSTNFYYYENIESCSELSFHDRKVLNEVCPNAFYLVDGKPKVIFFDGEVQNLNWEQKSKKIWNAQIPVIIVKDCGCIKVYNGVSANVSNIDKLQLDVLSEEEIGACNDFSPFSYWNITNEKFLREYQSRFSKNSLNEVMIENIKCITKKLKEEYKISFATKLILRIIFIRFLIDRGVNIGFEGLTGNVNDDQKRLMDIIGKRDSLYGLFGYLKDKFNGNLFELGSELESGLLNEEVFNLLESFLSGREEIESGQLSFLPLYDFNIIPIELISNIYEILLGDKVQQRDKAFYTPEYLADYIVNGTVGKYLQIHDECVVLDPACGSGIFLVETLQRIISKNVDEDGYVRDNSKLISLIEDNIYGVDLNPEAIDITIFSLYLLLLDYKDPKSLEGFKFPNLKDKNLFVSDFFNDEKLKKLKKIEFDVILGNPPWGSVKEGLHIRYCKENKIPMQRFEISRSFMAKVKDYSSEKTLCALVVPSKLFYNKQLPAVKFRKWLLETNEIYKFIEMSSVRELIFKKADAPAVVIMYKPLGKDCLNHEMVYISMKPNVYFNIYHIIATEKMDIKHISQKVLYTNDWAWKTCVYGTNWDIDNVQMLLENYDSLQKVIKNNNLKTAAGISDNEGKMDASDLVDRVIIDSKAIDSFYYDSTRKSIFKKDRIYRTGKIEQYNPPYCLMRKGPNCSSYRLRAAYVDDNVIFKEAISSIKGSTEQEELLHNIVGIINSSIYVYLNLMLGSSMGIEREQVFMNEIYKYPFVYDKEISKLAKSIQENNSKLENWGKRNDKYIDELDSLILKKFGLENDPFIDYAINVQIPMIHSKKWNYYEVSEVQLREYAEVFIQYWKPLMSQNGKFIEISIYPKVINKFAIFELKIVEQYVEGDIKIEWNVDSDKELLSKFMINKINEQFYYINDVIYFGDSSFYIVKTNEAKNWHKAIANIDNASVIESILSDGRED